MINLFAKTLVLLFFMFLIACSSEKKTGIEGNNNKDNTVIIADKVDNSKHTTIVEEKKHIQYIPSSFFKDVDTGTSIEYIKQTYGAPKEEDGDASEKEREYVWELKNGDITLFTYGNNGGIEGIDISLKKEYFGKPHIIMPNFLRNKNISFPSLGIAKFKDLIKVLPLIQDKISFRVRNSLALNGAAVIYFTIERKFDEISFTTITRDCCYSEKSTLEDVKDLFIESVSIMPSEYYLNILKK